MIADPHVWTVPGEVVRVIDGDSLVARLDLGWHVALTSEIRVDGMDAPERGTPEGDAAQVYAGELLPAGTKIVVASRKLLGSKEKYGRVLAAVRFPPPVAPRPLQGDFATAMIAAGHAQPWPPRVHKR